MATRPDDNPGSTPAEFPVPPGEPGEPGAPPESDPQGPDTDMPDSAPVELPAPD